MYSNTVGQAICPMASGIKSSFDFIDLMKLSATALSRSVAPTAHALGYRPPNQRLSRCSTGILYNPFRVEGQHLNNWTHWLFEKNDQNKTRLIGDSSDLTDLNMILGHPLAREAFEVKAVTLEKAKELTGSSDKQIEEALTKAIEYLEQADSLVLKVKVFYANIEDDVKAVRALANKIKRSIEDVQDEE